MILTCIFALLSLSMMADGEKTTVDGTKVQKITFEGDKIVVHYTDGTTADATFDMDMVVIDFSNATGMEERVAIIRRQGLEGKTIYNLKGQPVGSNAACLDKGIYLVGGKKIVIK